MNRSASRPRHPHPVRSANSPNTEKLTGRGAQRNIATLEMVHASLAKHSMVLKLRLPQGGSVCRNEDQLGLAGAHRLESRLETEGDLS